MKRKTALSIDICGCDNLMPKGDLTIQPWKRYMVDTHGTVWESVTDPKVFAHIMEVIVDLEVPTSIRHAMGACWHPTMKGKIKGTTGVQVDGTPIKEKRK